MREGLVHDDVLGEGPVDRWCGEEPHVRAEVVAPRQTVLAGQVRQPGFHGYPLTGPGSRHAEPHLNDLAGRLVAQHQRILGNEAPDPTVIVIVRVRAAHADRTHPDEDLSRPGARLGPLLDDDVLGSTQYGGSHQ
jgi:hypothetical protein